MAVACDFIITNVLAVLAGLAKRNDINMGSGSCQCKCSSESVGLWLSLSSQGAASVGVCALMGPRIAQPSPFCSYVGWANAEVTIAHIKILSPPC